jgi:hypothetical protein
LSRAERNSLFHLRFPKSIHLRGLFDELAIVYLLVLLSISAWERIQDPGVTAFASAETAFCPVTTASACAWTLPFSSTTRAKSAM